MSKKYPFFSSKKSHFFGGTLDPTTMYYYTILATSVQSIRDLLICIRRYVNFIIVPKGLLCRGVQKLMLDSVCLGRSLAWSLGHEIGIRDRVFDHLPCNGEL